MVCESWVVVTGSSGTGKATTASVAAAESTCGSLYGVSSHFSAYPSIISKEPGSSSYAPM